jgi:CheY-like chemotaxis protein
MSKIVFCEDDPMIQKLIRAALRTAPHEIHLAPDGSVGLEMVKRERPDVVFSDVSMPVMDGYQLGDALQSDPELRHIPIVFMTASVQRSQIEEASRHGAASVLAKPFTMADLRARVDEFTTKAD